MTAPEVPAEHRQIGHFPCLFVSKAVDLQNKDWFLPGHLLHQICSKQTGVNLIPLLLRIGKCKLECMGDKGKFTLQGAFSGQLEMLAAFTGLNK